MSSVKTDYWMINTVFNFESDSSGPFNAAKKYINTRQFEALVISVAMLSHELEVVMRK